MMTNRELATVLETLNSLRLYNMSPLRSWVESKVSLLFRLGAGIADSEDKRWAEDFARYRSRAEMIEEYGRRFSTFAQREKERSND